MTNVRARFALFVSAVAISGISLTGCNKSDQAEAEKAQREAAERAEKAQLEANEKISEARRDGEKAANEAAQARNDVRSRLQKDVDAVDRKIAYLKERAVEAKGAAKKNAEAAAAEAEKRRSTLRQDFNKLGTETGAAWDSAKAEVERDIAAVKAAVDSWESTITGKPAH
jgi:colicin import membrane protein